MSMDRWMDAQNDRKEKMNVLRTLRHLFSEPDPYAKFLIKLGIIVSMSEGRRLFAQLAPKAV